MKKQIGMLFAPQMIAAINEGRKTMTRRCIKPEVIMDKHSGYVYFNEHGGFYDIHTWKENILCNSRIQPEDLIYIKESHYRYGRWKRNGVTKSGRYKWIFVADKKITGTRYIENAPPKVQRNKDRSVGWYKRSALFMPKKCARLWLEVVSIRAEFLHSIPEEESEQEGILILQEDSAGKLYKDYLLKRIGIVNDAKESFRTLWCSINGEKSWNDNPAVWVIEFKKI